MYFYNCVRFSGNELIPWSRVLPDRLTIPQPFTKFFPFYGNRSLITTFTRAHHLPLSWARVIQCIAFRPISTQPILILSVHLRLALPSSLFATDFSSETLYEFHFSLIRHSDFILLDPIIQSFNHPIILISVNKTGNVSTRWFKYDRDKLWLVYTQIVPVIFEPPSITWHLGAFTKQLLPRKSNKYYIFLCVCVCVSWLHGRGRVFARV
jgi:hypothetical protein